MNALAMMVAAQDHERVAAAEAISRSSGAKAAPLQSPRPRHRVVGLAEMLSSAATCESLLCGKLEKTQFASQLAAMPPSAREQWVSAFGTCVSKMGRTVSELQRTCDRMAKAAAAGSSAGVLNKGAHEVRQRADALQAVYAALNEGIRAETGDMAAYLNERLCELVSHEGEGALRITKQWRRALVSALALARRETAVLEAAMAALATLSLARVQAAAARDRVGSGCFGSGRAGDALGDASCDATHDVDDTSGDGGGGSGSANDRGGTGTLEAVAAAVCDHVRLLLGCDEASLYLLVDGQHVQPRLAAGRGVSPAASASAPPVLCRLRSTHASGEEAAACDQLVLGAPAAIVPSTSLAGACMQASSMASLHPEPTAVPPSVSEPSLSAPAAAEAEAAVPMSSEPPRLLLVCDAASDDRFSEAADVLPGGAAPEAAVYLDLSDAGSGALRAVLRLACVTGGAVAAGLLADRRARHSNELAYVPSSDAVHRLLSIASQRLLVELKPLLALALREPLREALAATSCEAAKAHVMLTLSSGLSRLPTGAVAIGVFVGALGAVCAEALGAVSCTLFLHQDGGKLVGYPATGQGEPIQLSLPAAASASAGGQGAEGAEGADAEGGTDDEDEDASSPEDDAFAFGVLGACAKSGSYMLLNQLQPSDERLHPDIDAVPEGARGPLSLVCAPLRDTSGDHMLGHCELVRAAGVAPFADDDRPAVLAVLRTVAIAIDNYFLCEMLDDGE